MSFWKVRFDPRHALRGSRLQSGRNAALGDADPLAVHSPVVFWQSDQAVLKVGSGRVLSRAHACELGRQISELLNEPAVRVLRIDLADVPVVNSELLSQFTRAHCRASQLGKVVRLENPNRSVQEVFNLTRLDRLFAMNGVERASAVDASQLTS